MTKNQVKIKKYVFYAKKHLTKCQVDVIIITEDKTTTPKGKEVLMTIKKYTINGKLTEIITTNTFVDQEGYVHIPADYETFDEYFDAWFDSLPSDEK